MPRVNRDLQRRMAARRDRERRRPTGDRRYRFSEATEPALEPDETLVTQDEVTETVEAAPPRPSSRPGRERALATDGTGATRAPTKTAPKPFSAYRDEYAYVFSDLRRIAVVIGSLLVVLIVLYFVLPLLIH